MAKRGETGGDSQTNNLPNPMKLRRGLSDSRSRNPRALPPASDDLAFTMRGTKSACESFRNPVSITVSVRAVPLCPPTHGGAQVARTRFACIHAGFVTFWHDGAEPCILPSDGTHKPQAETDGVRLAYLLDTALQ